MSFSYSSVRTFSECPYKYKLKYIDKLKPKKSIDPSSPLYLGTACHTGIETRSIEKAIEEYKSNFTYLNPLHEMEIYKLSKVLEVAIKEIPEGDYEYKLEGPDGFVGYIDELVPVGDGIYDILDFKYSNNVSKYKKSGQIHIYQYYFEKLTGKSIRNISYAFISKLKNPDDTPSVKIVTIPYNQHHVDIFFFNKEKMDGAKEYEKKPSDYCRNCDYYRYCVSNGQDTAGLEVKEEVEQVSLFG